MSENPQNAGDSAGNRSQAGWLGNPEKSSARITPELVSQLADRVYTLWLLDLKVEKERGRQGSNPARPLRGGR
jgi:hypothetical protein